MIKVITSLFILIFIFKCESVFAQKTVRGHIEDAKNGKPLAAANIQIEGTFQGTISNQDGDFVILIEQIPSNILITYIGYESQKIRIDQSTPDRILIRMTPIILEMDPIVISAEDPAMAIMREVIRRKLEWRAKLITYKAQLIAVLSLRTIQASYQSLKVFQRHFGTMKKDPVKLSNPNVKPVI